jgi:hypothetical protein
MAKLFWGGIGTAFFFLWCLVDGEAQIIKLTLWMVALNVVWMLEWRLAGWIAYFDFDLKQWVITWMLGSGGSYSGRDRLSYKSKAVFVLIQLLFCSCKSRRWGLSIAFIARGNPGRREPLSVAPAATLLVTWYPISGVWRPQWFG